VVCALGDPDRALEFVTALVGSGAAATRWLHLPRTPAAAVADRLPVRRQDDWDFLWTATDPPRVAGEERIVALPTEAHAAVLDLLERGFPETTSRPGDPRVRAWYGRWDGDRLIAAGADRSRGGVGFLAGLTVDPGRRGSGIGAALAAAMTRRLRAEFGQVALGVMYDNNGAIRLYRRLGYGGSLPRTSVALGRPVETG
jgi:GNAT superfamily N-acetyltransferase